jgi:alpha-L-rhamnosidase
MDLTVPHNTTASVMLPYAKMDGLIENEETIKNQPLYSKAMEKDAGVEVELGSGTYSFSYPLDINILPDVPASITDRSPQES